MKFLKLRQRLLLLTLLPSGLIALLLVIYFTLTGLGSLDNQLRAKALATARYLAPVSEYGIIAGQLENLHSLVQATMQEPGVKAALIVNQRGRTMAVSGRVSLSADILRQTLKAPAMVAETGDWIAFGAPVTRSQNDVDPLFDIEGEKQTEETIGHVFIEFDKRAIREQQHALLLRALLVVVIGLGLMALLAIGMADSLARPLLRLARAVGLMSAGQFDARVAATSSGELRVLEDGFNEMAEHIEEVHRSMQARIEDATAQLVFQARHDSLTGLINRREFELLLERALDALHTGGDEFSMLYVDLDRFKPVNDTCGHIAGDELLRQIALLLKGRLREEDTLGRLGGDEFGIILYGCTGERAAQVAADLCALAAEYRFVWQDKIFAIGASIGLTPVTRDVRNIQEIVALSDAACQQAKALGRNQVYESRASAPIERRQERGNWASRLSSALTDGRLLVEAIPIRPIRPIVPDGAPLHIAELSARLNEPGQPPIALSALIDAAERYDMAVEFERHFLQTAIAALARAARRKRLMHCLVPISLSSISQGRTIDFIASRLTAEDVTGAGLHLMLPEDTGTNHASQVIEFCRRVQALGCQIVIAEFGGGMASFNLLRTIEPAYVKLSQSLTRDLGDNRTSRTLLRAVLEITSSQEILAVAEDVDDSLHASELADIGVGYAEGRAIAPREPFDAWMEGAVLRGTEED